MKNDIFKKMLSNVLRKTADDLDSGVYDCNDDEIADTLDILSSMNSTRELSKEEACRYLNMSRSTFDTYIRNGWIPQG